MKCPHCGVDKEEVKGRIGKLRQQVTAVFELLGEIKNAADAREYLHQENTKNKKSNTSWRS